MQTQQKPKQVTKSFTDTTRQTLLFSVGENESIWSRSDAIDILQIGCLVRIADALEKIHVEQRNQKPPASIPPGPVNVGEILRELNKMQVWYGKKISSLNTKIGLLNKRIAKMETK